jgi:hypothetical protein
VLALGCFALTAAIANAHYRLYQRAPCTALPEAPHMALPEAPITATAMAAFGYRLAFIWVGHNRLASNAYLTRLSPNWQAATACWRYPSSIKVRNTPRRGALYRGQSGGAAVATEGSGGVSAAMAP